MTQKSLPTDPDPAEVEMRSLSECEDGVNEEVESEIESEFELDPLVSSAGESMADISKDVAHKVFLLSNAMYTDDGESLTDVLSDVRTALKNMNKILYNMYHTKQK